MPVSSRAFKQVVVRTPVDDKPSAVWVDTTWMEAGGLRVGASVRLDKHGAPGTIASVGGTMYACPRCRRLCLEYVTQCMCESKGEKKS